MIPDEAVEAAAKWMHAEPCTCWAHPDHGPIIGAECIMAMAGANPYRPS